MEHAISGPAGQSEDHEPKLRILNNVLEWWTGAEWAPYRFVVASSVDSARISSRVTDDGRLECWNGEAWVEHMMAPPGQAPDLPDVSNPAARLRFLAQRRHERDERAKTPVIRRAQAHQACPRCTVRILVNDEIASWPDGVGWMHLECAICPGCGDWLMVRGAHATCAEPHP